MFIRTLDTSHWSGEQLGCLHDKTSVITSVKSITQLEPPRCRWIRVHTARPWGTLNFVSKDHLSTRVLDLIGKHDNSLGFFYCRITFWTLIFSLVTVSSWMKSFYIVKMIANRRIKRNSRSIHLEKKRFDLPTKLVTFDKISSYPTKYDGLLFTDEKIRPQCWSPLYEFVPVRR